MLTRVEVRTRQGTQLNLPLEDVENGFLIDEIEGLDPVKAAYSSSRVTNQSGERKNSSQREKRNLKLKLTLEPDFVDTSVRDLRRTLYSYLMPEETVTLRFHDSLGSYVDIVADVESFDTPLFTDEPAVDISLLCFDPDFFDPNPFTFSGVSAADVNTLNTVNYYGTVKAGVLFTLRPDRPITSFSLIHVLPSGDTQQLDFAEALQAGDVVTISTIPGTKGATLTRAGNISSLLYAVSPQSDWIALRPGVNRIRVAITGNPVPFDIQYVTRYGGL